MDGRVCLCCASLNCIDVQKDMIEPDETRFTAEELVQRAEHAVTTLQPELASKFYERALAVAPQETKIMDLWAELLLGLGETGKAKKLLERSIDLEPSSGASKWLYLGQLQDGWTSLQSLHKGADLLRAELEARQARGLGDDDESAVIKNQISSAYCGIAELYLTDLCYEENAETECQAALDRAMEVDQGSPEVSQALANLRLSQVRGEEAAALMLETCSRLKACGEDTMPSVEFRLSTAKLLLECHAHNRKCARKAVDVLEQCKCEDDENVEMWYLLGVAYFVKVNPDLELAKRHLTAAQQLLERSKQAGEHCPDQEKLVEDQLRLVLESEKKGGCAEEEEEDGSGSSSDDVNGGDDDDAVDEMECDAGAEQDG